MDEKNNELGLLLKGLLKERNLSMRKLSEMTGVDTAIISKVINGKRKATPDHLQRFSEQLDISISKLYEAAGYPVDRKKSDFYDSIGDIQSIMETTNLIDKEFRLNDVKQEFEKYQQLSLEEEGTETVLGQFDEKVDKVGGMGHFIHHLKDMYEQFSRKKGTKTELALMGGALLYFIVAVDCIPDYLFPVGFIDDAVVINWVINGMAMKK
ncbi:DUF1232 domain-containing protein [Litchfieldia salsa]|uniref:Uncharacterized membrane protein YkvA, DUF1232 family n=1 Tax=Litchfieldia salsa TaxID=930152 RepID=A0A1H0VSL8_9BACI|nr:DUF1232 domain-containing protein [Litchfieldia salsa]SDP81440.1 Uncharacterized membrane protein YkvA, DUF1232 family [Litchfieldia salsa]